MVVEMSGEEGKLFQSFQSIINQQVKLRDGLGKTGQASRKAAKEQAELTRAAKRYYDQTRTPQERYNAKLKELDGLLKQNKVSQDTYNRAVRQAKEQLNAASAAGKKVFGSEALAGVAKLAAAYVSVRTAVSTVTRALTDMEAKRADAAERVRQSRMGAGSLAQVATSPENMKALKEKAEDFYRGAGAATLDEAYRTVFAVKSAGQMEHLEFFKELRASGMIETPDVMARAARTLEFTMGKKETGDMRAIVSKALGASAYSPVSAEALLEAASQGAGIAKAIGLRDEEILALTAMTATAGGKAGEGGTMMTALLTSLEEAGLEKGTLLEKLKTIEAAGGIRGAKYGEFFGRKESRRAYRAVMENLGQYKSALADVDKAQRTDEVGRRLKYHEADPGLVAARAAEEAEHEEKLSRDELAMWHNRATTIQTEFETRLRKEGQPEWRNWATQMTDTVMRKFIGDELYVRYMTPMANLETVHKFGLLNQSRPRGNAPVVDLSGRGGGEATTTFFSQLGETKKQTEVLQVVSDTNRDNTAVLRGILGVQERMISMMQENQRTPAPTRDPGVGGA